MEKLKNICNHVKKVFPPEISWSKDERFNTSLIVFDYAEKDTIRGKILEFFDAEYSSSTVKKASKPEKNLIKLLFGLKKDQFLYVTEDDGILLFASWWPWGNLEKISLRIGLYTHENDISDEDISTHLSQWFGI